MTDIIEAIGSTVADAEEMSLVITLEGKVSASNFPDFKAYIMELLQQHDKPLKSAEDFTEAEIFVENLKKFEAGIAIAKQRALESTADINEFFREIAALEESVKVARERQEQQIKAEAKRQAEAKAKEKAAIIAKGKKDLLALIDEFKSHEVLTVAVSVIDNAVARKKTIETMQAAIDAEIVAQRERLTNLDLIYMENYRLINLSKETNPGLYPDIKTLMIKTKEEVEAIIEARVATTKLAQHEIASKDVSKPAEVKPSVVEETKIDPVLEKVVNAVPEVRKITAFGGVLIKGSESAVEIDVFKVTVTIKAPKDRAVELAQDLDAYTTDWPERESIGLSK